MGNSLTYTNDLPSILEYIAKENNISLHSKCLCYPNYALEDHWNDGEFQKIITGKKYNYVIFQQGPSSQQEGRQMLFEYGAKITTLSKQNNAESAYFMVWPSRKHYSTFNGVIKNYMEAAKANEALLIPVGTIWKEYQEGEYNGSLYSRDLFHPSSTGSFMAALTIFHILFPDKTLTDLDYGRYKKWVKNTEDFKTIIALVIKNR
ncbi:SGNH/GDSL hydrolase family protein [Leptobacterium sp. I13]|uniref:SGNH/GDSL hydrolase family protein n=1 Tax=Leptobacterium meishanense TaxID=3128904 RepID=UPI0030EB512B